MLVIPAVVLDFGDLMRIIAVPSPEKLDGLSRWYNPLYLQSVLLPCLTHATYTLTPLCQDFRRPFVSQQPDKPRD